MTRKGYRLPIADRLDRHTDKSGGLDACWPYTGGNTRKDKTGYGLMVVNGQSKTAHHVMYELVFGPVPPGVYVCHHCDNPPCCNPAHLFMGPPKANVQDMVSKGRARGGARNPRVGEAVNLAKLTAAQVAEMRRLRSEGTPYQELVERFGIAYSTVERICRGTDWKHVDLIDPAQAKRVAHDRRRRASQHNHSRLTPDQVREIRATPGVPLRTLAQRFGVSAQAVANVRNGKTWTEVE